MPTYYVDNRAAGANNGSSPADAWQSLADISGLVAGDVINFVPGSGPYREVINLVGNGAPDNYIRWHFNGCRVTAADDMNDSAYKWTPSGGGINEYYLEAAAGGNPGLVQINSVTVNGYLWIASAEASHQMGAPGALSDRQPGWGDNDTLGFNTLYIRSDAGAPSSLIIEASQRNYTLNSNWRYHKFNAAVLTHGNQGVVQCRQSILSEPWIFDKCLFAYSNFDGIESNNGSFKVTSSLFYWCGHRAINLIASTIPVAATVHQCTEWGAHLFARVAAAVNANATLDIQNCLSGDNEAGTFDIGSATVNFTENNNLFFPRMTAAGGALGYVNTANWPTTNSTDIPASVATTEDAQSNLLQPKIVRTLNNGYDFCDFRLKKNSPAFNAGADLGLTEYYDGTPITQNINIGAFPLDAGLTNSVDLSSTKRLNAEWDLSSAVEL